MYKIAICDDQPEALKEIEKRINSYTQMHPTSVSVTMYGMPKLLLEDFADGLYYDIIFIDIEMPGLDGLQTIKKIKAISASCLIIIISSHPQYAIDAIELEVFRYLVKGHMEHTFNLCFEAALKRVDLNAPQNYFILSSRKHIKIPCKDILYCYKESKTSIFVTDSGEIRERKTLHDVLNDLRDICDFFIMIERGHIVNLNHIQKLSDHEVLLDNGLRLPIGYTYINEVKKQINAFWRKTL